MIEAVQDAAGFVAGIKARLDYANTNIPHNDKVSLNNRMIAF